VEPIWTMGRRSTDTKPSMTSSQPHCRLAMVRSMVGFVAGLPFMYQDGGTQAADPGAEIPQAKDRYSTVDRRPRRLLWVHLLGAGVRAATRCSASRPMPIFDPTQTTSYLRDFMVFFRPGDIVKFKPIDRDGYDTASRGGRQGTLQPAHARSHLRSPRIPRRYGGATTPGWRLCSMAIRVLHHGLANVGPGSRTARLFPSRHPHGRGDGPVRDARGPTCWSATPRTQPDWKSVFMGPKLEFTKDGPLSRLRGAEMHGAG